MKTRHKLLSLFTLITTSFIGTCAINTFIKVRAHSKHLMHSDTSLYYKWRLGKIHYTKTGQGSPLLLLHDLCPASSGCEWERILSSLSKKFTVYVPDLIGFGQSEKPDITYTNPLLGFYLSKKSRRGDEDSWKAGKELQVYTPTSHAWKSPLQHRLLEKKY